MPQASDELRAEMKKFYGDEISEAGPTNFLIGQGYTLTPAWYWIAKPGVKDYAQMTQQEWLSMVFLRDEWDYGMINQWSEIDP